MAPVRKVKVFLSYCHRDLDDCTAFVTYINNLIQNGSVQLFWDQDLTDGEWSADIFDELDRADLILLMVTPEYIASENCRKEYVRALERYKARTARVAPIWLKDADYTRVPFAKLTPFPPGNWPIDRYERREEGFQKTLDALEKVVQSIRAAGIPPFAGTSCEELAELRKRFRSDEQQRLLPHLCDRTDQETAVRRGLSECKKFQDAADEKKGRRPFVYLLNGVPEDCPEGFQMRLAYRVLPGELRIAGRIIPIPIDWPETYGAHDAAKESFEWRLAAKLDCTREALWETVKQRPVTLIRTAVDSQLWENDGPKMLDAFIDFCGELRNPAGGIAIGEVLFQFGSQEGGGQPAGGWLRHLLGSEWRERKRMQRTEEAMHAALTELEKSGLHNPGVRGAVVPLDPIRWVHAQSWIGVGDVRAWCAANSEAAMATDLKGCLGEGSHRMEHLLPTLDGLLFKYKKAN
jgi:hypothetical protein